MQTSGSSTADLHLLLALKTSLGRIIHAVYRMRFAKVVRCHTDARTAPDLWCVLFRVLRQQSA